MHYFHPVLEHGLPHSLTLNHNAYSIFPRFHVGMRDIGTFYLCQSLVNGLHQYLSKRFKLSNEYSINRNDFFIFITYQDVAEIDIQHVSTICKFSYICIISNHFFECTNTVESRIYKKPLFWIEAMVLSIIFLDMCLKWFLICETLLYSSPPILNTKTNI